MAVACDDRMANRQAPATMTPANVDARRIGSDLLVGTPSGLSSPRSAIVGAIDPGGESDGGINDGAASDGGELPVVPFARASASSSQFGCWAMIAARSTTPE